MSAVPAVRVKGGKKVYYVVICVEGLIVLARKKEESTNEKIVRLYKQGHSFDDISKLMGIPKGNIVGTVEKYFPDYQTYVQPPVERPIPDDKDNKGNKGKFPPVPFLKRNGKGEREGSEKITINLDMDDEGYIDKTSQQIAKMLKNGRGVTDVAEFFNMERVNVQAVRDTMDEHFKRVEASKKPEPKKDPDPDENKFSNFATGLEADQASISKTTRPKYTPPTYSKRNDPKPVSASYGLADNAAKEEKPAEAAPEADTSSAAAEEPFDEAAAIEAVLLEKVVEAANLPPVIEKEEEEEHKVSLIPDGDGSDGDKPAEEHKVSLLGDDTKEEDVKAETPVEETAASEEAAPTEEETAEATETPEMDEILEIPSIESVSPEELEKELAKAPDPVEDIPEIGFEDDNAEILTETKEVYPGMSALEKMKQFAQEQIALNNKKIDELKAKKTDAENEAFDCNTKVESMKKEIEDMQAKLLVLIDEKDKAGKVVSDINEEIEAINKENSDYGSYL